MSKLYKGQFKKGVKERGQSNFIGVRASGRGQFQGVKAIIEWRMEKGEEGGSKAVRGVSERLKEYALTPLETGSQRRLKRWVKA